MAGTGGYYDPTTNTYYGDGYAPPNPWDDSGGQGQTPGSGGGGGNGGNVDEGGTEQIPYVPPAPDTPPYVHTRGQKRSKINYVDYIRWQRGQLINLLKRYREGYPEQIKTYKEAAYGALPKKQEQLWGNMYSNLDQRGLSDSASFLGGARNSLEEWLSGEKQRIEETAQGMEMTAQQAILTAIGRPQYAQLYQQWNNFDQQLNDALYKKFVQREANRGKG